MRSPFHLFAAAAFAAAVTLPSIAQDANAVRMEASLKKAFDSRAEAAAIVYLYRASELGDVVPDRSVLRRGLERVESAADGQPEVRAHARELLRGLRKLDGAWDEAERLGTAQGFLTRWLLLGPYSDEGKSGWDSLYDPERALDWKARFPGKDHEIGWRSAPDVPQADLVRLDSLLDPSEKVVAYAATFVKVERDTACVLRGGYNEAHKLWVDGELVGGMKRYNGRAFDQFADGCTLRKGWNLILVKVCNQESGWNFQLRLTDTAGAALQGWTASADPSSPGEPLASILAKDGAPRSGLSVFDPGVELERLSTRSPAAGLLWGEYLYRQRTFDRTEPKDTPVLKAACEGLRSDPWAWLVLGDAEGETNRRRAAFERALGADPKFAPALVRLGELALRQGMALVGARAFAQALEADPESLSARCALDRVRLRFLTDGAAAADLDALGARFPEAICVQQTRIEALRTLGRGEALLAALKVFAEANQSVPSAQQDLLMALQSAGRTEAVLDLFQKTNARFPLDRDSARAEARYLLGLDRPGEARKALEPALAWAPDWADGQQLAGDIALALGEREAALVHFRRALTLKPQDEELRRKIGHLKPEEEDFYSAYRVEREEVPVPTASDRESQLAVLVDNSVVRVQKSGLASRYVQKVLEVCQPGAARQMQYFPISFDPDRESVRVLEASRLRPDGTKFRADSFVTDALSDPQYKLYYRNRNVVLDFSGVQPGDRIWVEYVLSDTAESNEYGAYFGDLVPFGAGAPVLLKRYTLQLPAELHLTVGTERLGVRPIVVTRADQKIYSWTLRDTPRSLQEPGMPGPTETEPYLHVSTFADWPTMGAWYARFIQDQWEASPAVKEQVATLVRGKTTPEEKVAAIHRWVVQQTRYVGLEFGVHGYLPYKVRQIFDRRFGDCKDKALLLSAMLQEAGVEACMVLIRTRDLGAIAEAPASLAVFNHAICYVPALDLYLDGTAEYSGMRELPWQDQGVEVLLVWPDGRARRATTPVDRASANRFDAQYEVRAEAGSAEVDFTTKIRFEGQECAWVRRNYQDPAKQRELMEKGLSGSFPGTRVDRAVFTDLSDIDRPTSVEASGRLGAFGRADGARRSSYPTWPGALNLAGQFGSTTERVFPLVIHYPWTQSYSVRFALPAGAVAEAPQELDQDSPSGHLTRRVTRGEGWVEVTTAVTLAPRRVEAADYAAFRAFCIEADRTVSERVRVTFPGGAQ